MKEDFLWFVWRYQKITMPLRSINGKIIQVLKTGYLNESDGPDFQEAEILVDGVRLNGSVECHLKSSDWLAHKHDNNPKYGNVVLHFVWNDDKIIPSLDKNKALIVEAKNLVDKSLINSYQRFLLEKEQLPCHHGIQKLPIFSINNMLERALIHRMEQRIVEVYQLVKHFNDDYLQLTWSWLLRSFGFGTNKDALTALSIALPIKVVLKHSNSILSLEALLLGTANLLGEDDNIWAKEYEFLSAKYQLEPISKNLWIYGRVRPQSFPEIRLSQLANLLHKQPEVLHFIDADLTIEQWLKLFSTQVSKYWESHSRTGVPSNPSKKSIGKTARENLVINYIVPLLIFISQRHNKEELKQRAFDLLENIKPENNIITRGYEAYKFKNKSAYDSQAIIGLKKYFCDQKKCLHCNIGVSIINRDAD